jgi:hypothetical protein
MLRMVIDRVLVNVYTCCKCANQWTNWPKESIPLNCPRCRNVRWNQHYTKDEYVLIEQLEKEHIIKIEETSSEYARLLGKDVKNTVCYLDFIMYDFIYGMRPLPDIFEITQVLAIPTNKVEERHELMLSIIRDRITNIEKYKKERYSKYGIDYYGEIDSKHYRYAYVGDHDRRIRAMIEGCNHEDTLEIRSALYTSKYPYNKGQITQEEVKREKPKIKIKLK